MKSSYVLACVALFCFVALSSQQTTTGYISLSSQQVYLDIPTRGALEYGFLKIIHNLTKAEKIPKDKYQIFKIITAARQIVDGTDYKFKIEIENEKGTRKITSSYTVHRTLKGMYSLRSSDNKIPAQNSLF